MTKINFYFNVASSADFVPRLVRRVLGDGRALLIHATDQRAAQELDQWLWTWNDQSFLPHCLASAAEAEQTPVQITWPGGPVPSHHQWLLNLAPQQPGIFSRFEKLLEVVTVDDEAVAAGRARFLFYRERGYALESFDMAGK